MSLPLDSSTPRLAFCAHCGARTEERLVEGCARPVCTACGRIVYLDPKLAVAVLIARDGRILLGKRGPGAREPGKWSFPAGFVERCERVERAAAREAREETGLDIVVGNLIGLYSSDGETVVLAVYEATSAVGEPRAGDDLTEVGWFSTSELPELAFPRDRRIMDAWLTAQSAVGSRKSERGPSGSPSHRLPTPSRYGARGPGDRAPPRGSPRRRSDVGRR